MDLPILMPVRNFLFPDKEVSGVASLEAGGITLDAEVVTHNENAPIDFRAYSPFAPVVERFKKKIEKDGTQILKLTDECWGKSQDTEIVKINPDGTMSYDIEY